MLVGTRYTRADIADHYDAIVVGSGLGGLTTAALLAQQGLSCLVLERHYTAGGFTHSFRRRGFEWDVGVHYVGQVHNPASPLRRVFDAISEGRLTWARMDDNYDRIIVKDESYDFMAGAAAFRDELLRSFPSAGNQIDGYLREIRAGSRNFGMHFGPRYLPTPLDSVAGAVSRRTAGNYFGRTTKDALGAVVTDPRLAGVLTGQWGDYGLPPGQSSFGMHATVAQHYLGGASFPVGGAWQIANSIVPTIERAGGSVVVDAEVDAILVRDDHVRGVRMADGGEIHSDRVISDVGIRNTYLRLLPLDVATRHGVVGKASHLRPAVGHIGLYVGLHGTAADLNLSQTNLWLHRDYDHDASLARYLDARSTDLPFTYISFPSAKDPSWQERYPGKSTIDVITVAPYDWFASWAGTAWRKRGSEYDDLKARLAERMLDDVYAHVPQVRGKVAYFELSTPLSTRQFANYSRGEVYGLAHSPERFQQTWIKPRTPIGGLHLTGQDLLFCGVGSVLMSGVITAASVLGRPAGPMLLSVVAPEASARVPAWARTLLG